MRQNNRNNRVQVLIVLFIFSIVDCSLLRMDDLHGTNLTSNLSTKISSTPDNQTVLTSKSYVFSPVSPATKLILFILLVSVGIVGFVGNILILCFLKSKKKTASFLRACAFQQNFVFYIKSLAISDTLCAVTGNPILTVEFYFDIFQQDWSCRAARYFNIVFPSVTMNNLLVISIEKYFSTRRVPRTFRHSTVKKLVWFAWVSAIFYVLIPTSTFKGVRYGLNETHYTVSCKYDKHYLPFRIMFLTNIVFQYLIPCFIMIIISICLILTLSSRMKKTVDIQQDNAIKAMLRAAKRRGTIITITLVLAFVLPYFLYFGQVIYNMVTKADVSYETDFIIRYGSGLIAFSNSAVNVIIYCVQMRDFRAFLKELFISCFATGKPAEVEPVEMQQQ